jgi:hypothetical protein
MEKSRKERQKLLEEKRELALEKQNKARKAEELMEQKAMAKQELEEARALLEKKKAQA